MEHWIHFVYTENNMKHEVKLLFCCLLVSVFCARYSFSMTVSGPFWVVKVTCSHTHNTHTHAHTQTHTQLFNGPLSWTTRVSWYQKKFSPTYNTHDEEEEEEGFV